MSSKKKAGNHCYLSPLLTIITELFHIEEGWGGGGGVESPKSHTLKNETGLLFTGDSLINTFAGS